MFRKNVISGCIFLALLTKVVAADPATQGWVEGQVKIFPLGDANLKDDGNPATTAAEQLYSEFSLVVRSRHGKREITYVAVDRNGNYRVELQPGDYILEVHGPDSKATRVKSRLFSIVSGQTTHVDLNIDTGIR